MQMNQNNISSITTDKNSLDFIETKFYFFILRLLADELERVNLKDKTSF